MADEREVDRGDSLLLTNEDRGGGFSIRADNHHNITLSKWSKPLAWFSVAVTREVLKGFLELVKYCEKRKRN